MSEGTEHSGKTNADDLTMIDVLRLAEIFCGGCGRTWEDSASFCAKCGAPKPAVDSLDHDPSEGISDVADASADLRMQLAPEASISGFIEIDVAPTPSKEKSGRRKWLVVGAAGLVVLVVAAFVTMRPEGRSYDLEAALVRSESQVGVWASRLDRATTLAQLNSSGASAAAAVTKLDSELAGLDAVGNETKRRLSRSALLAAKDLSAQLGGLAKLKPETLDDWDDESGQAKKAAEKLATAASRLAAAGVSTRFGAIAKNALAGIAAVDDLLDGFKTKVTGWKTEFQKFETDKASQTATLKSYSEAMRVQLGKYGELRKDLGAFTEQVDSTGATYQEAYTFMGGAVAKRQEVRNAIASLTPPAPIAGGHSGLLSVIDTSISAVQSAIEGIRQDQFSYYSYYKNTAGWQSFQQKSRQISESYGTSVSVWEKLVADEQARLTALTPPTAPTI